MIPDTEGISGHYAETDWNGRPVRAWVPAPLRERPLVLSASTARAGERACAAIRLAEARLPDHWEPLARLLLQNEGMASSAIEGLREPAEAVLVAGRTGSGGAAGWVADNLVVIDRALETAHAALTVETLHGWHRQLMRHGMLSPGMIGTFRPVLGWVGGSTPVHATYVPPPPQEIPRLVEDLIRFADGNPPDMDPVSHAAVIHAQFEAIHPYGDGNGRLGRVLIGRTLHRSGLTRRSSVPISMAITRDPAGYLSGLHLFEQGEIDPWVRWFAEMAERAASATGRILDRTEALMVRWEKAVTGLRSDHGARALLPNLPAHPILSAGDVAGLLGSSERSARTALAALAARGVLSPIDVPSPGPGRNRHWFIAHDLLDLWQA